MSLNFFEANNEQIALAFGRARHILASHYKIFVSISGGSDSDIMLDIIQKTIIENDFNSEDFHYVFFDTGFEYQATKQHLDYLEQKYGITIERVRAKTPIPLAVKNYGYPFISKDISAKIYCLQNNKFDFKNDGYKDYEYLSQKYSKIKSVIKWWCNKKKSSNINSNKFLKEFLIENPPYFNISDRCCSFAKKIPSHKYEKENFVDLKCLGLRASEGGIRASKFKNCFSFSETDIDNYRPLWFFDNIDKQMYKDFYKIQYSDCYEIWGLKRTGCAGCPFNSKYKEDLEIVKKYEPKLYNACMNIFGEAYSYREAYNEFKNKRKEFLKTNLDCQTNLFEEGK